MHSTSLFRVIAVVVIICPVALGLTSDLSYESVAVLQILVLAALRASFDVGKYSGAGLALLSVAGLQASTIFRIDQLETSQLATGILSALAILLIGGMQRGEATRHLLPGASHKKETIKPTQQGSDEGKFEHGRFITLINSMADGVIATDSERRITLYNGAALDVLDSNVSLELQPAGDHLHILDENNKPFDIFKAADKANSYYVSRDLQLQLPDEEKLHIYISVSQVRYGFGVDATKGYVMVLRDITKEKTLEEERDEFISVVSHELRTPITVAEGSISNAQVILDGKDGKKKVVPILEQAHDQVVFLADMINDLSTLSRAERGTLQIEPESLDPNDLLTRLQEDYHIDAESSGLELKIKTNDEAKTVVTSKLYVREILQNFITNSIKYTDTGSITIGVQPHARGVEFTVTDTGIGISAADQKKLFEKFFRAEDYRTRQSSGTGLGLYVTAKLADIVGAEISVDSTVGKGSTFTVLVPSLDRSSERKDQAKKTKEAKA